MSHQIGVIDDIPLEYHYGIWTINPFRGHSVLEDWNMSIRELARAPVVFDIPGSFHHRVALRS